MWRKPGKLDCWLCGVRHRKKDPHLPTWWVVGVAMRYHAESIGTKTEAGARLVLVAGLGTDQPAGVKDALALAVAEWEPSFLKKRMDSSSWGKFKVSG